LRVDLVARLAGAPGGDRIRIGISAW
jgi:hypothetical protein